MTMHAAVVIIIGGPPYHMIIGGPPYAHCTAVVSDQIDEEATLCGGGTGQPLRWHHWATTKNATQRITITHY